MDVIFQKKYYKHIRLKGILPEEDNEEEIKWHSRGVQEELIKKLKRLRHLFIMFLKTIRDILIIS